MKRYLNAILVVEGKADKAYLANYFASEIVVVNGYEMAKPTLDYLKDKQVIVLTDPDEAGQWIRQKLNRELNKVINVEVDSKQCIRGFKKGVAECTIAEIFKKLQPYILKEPYKEGKITTADLQKIGLINDVELRTFVCQKLHLGRCNLKQLIKRLNYHRIQLEELQKLIKEYHGN
ncbi:MAG: DUF4093 domain-containing protein [Erysipelotrichia bacterium]|nr:DUF4093 domain-containing protein [Erysipelotrichia bacterium]